MNDIKKPKQNDYYKAYVQKYIANNLNVVETRNRLKRLSKQDIRIVNDSVCDFEEWLIDVEGFTENECENLISTLKDGVENKFHVINADQFREDLTNIARALFESKDSGFDEQSFLMSEAIRLIEVVCDKGKRIRKMENKMRALDTLDNDIENNRIKLGKRTGENAVIKPHKDEIYEWYGEIKENSRTVDDAFYALEEKIKEEGLSPADYYKTDTPQNLDRSYSSWLLKKRQNKK